MFRFFISEIGIRKDVPGIKTNGESFPIFCDLSFFGFQGKPYLSDFHFGQTPGEA
jgi:hypothetical protein